MVQRGKDLGVAFEWSRHLEGPHAAVACLDVTDADPLHQFTTPMLFRSGVDGVPAGTSRRSGSAVAG